MTRRRVDELVLAEIIGYIFLAAIIFIGCFAIFGSRNNPEPPPKETISMPHVHLQAVGLTDPPPFAGLEPIFHDNRADWSLFVINAGMTSGEPSVFLVAHTDSGDVALETSLAAFLAAAQGLKGMAETQFGWVQQP